MSAISEQHARENMLSAIANLRKVPLHPEMFSFMFMAFVEASEEGITEERAPLYRKIFQEMSVTKEEFNNWLSAFAKYEGYSSANEEEAQSFLNFYFV